MNADSWNEAMTGFVATCNNVCGSLPDDWKITVELERGAGNVSLTDPFGNCVDYPEDAQNIGHSLDAAIEYAREHATGEP